MSDPIKIIWKYKNNNNRIQYNTYIFVGKLVPEKIKTILEKIKNYNFYDTLINLANGNDYKELTTFYGEKWYTYFFNVYHINSTIFLIKDTTSQKDEIIDLYGESWYDQHINIKEILSKKIIYSYESIIKSELEKNNFKKGRNVAIGEIDDDIDYTLTKKIDYKKLFTVKNDEYNKVYNYSKKNKDDDKTDDDKTDDDETDDDKTDDDETDDEKDNKNQIGGTNNILIGGNKEEDDEETNDDETDDEETDDEETDDEEIDDEETDDEEIDDEETDFSVKNKDYDTEKSEKMDESDNDDNKENTNNEIDVTQLSDDEEEDIADIYVQSENVDKHVNETSKLIEKALNDKNIFEKKNKNMAVFDTSKDNNMYDENLRDIFNKIYIYEQYIYKDDTIENIKNKICCSIKCNEKFGEDLYLIPSRQYLWGEYYYNNLINKIMIGQKWLKRNELLTIDIEPNNNIRIYEELKGPLGILKDNIKRGNKRIKMDDDNNNILFDYDEYLTNNEIYMIDIYNELGLKYGGDDTIIKNLQEIYVKIYFPQIKMEDFKNIIDLLNDNPKNEINKTIIIYETINNDLIIETEIMTTVDSVKMNEKFEHIFKNNHITQSVIHLKLRDVSGKKLNLYRIFNEFEVTDKYPFIQFQTNDGNIIYKFNKEEISKYSNNIDERNILLKWLENVPYGISIKVKITEPSENKNTIFMAININENGRVEYKTGWKEQDMATMENIIQSYEYIKKVVTKINTEDNKITLEIPENHEFKFAYINTIQKFEFPEKFMINHNDLSEFARYFYPYISLVIDPRKRQSKIQKNDDKSKFGTYLRYKRVSKYENNVRIEQRIIYFIRNYEFTDSVLASEIGKQFNITEEKALEEYKKVKIKYPYLKKSRKILKKFENISKFKPPGIGIDIQGKSNDKYKIRIFGARSKEQLDRIVILMNILLYLYIEIYYFKKSNKQHLLKKLELLQNIASRRGKVEYFVDHTKVINSIKQMAKQDKQRIGFKPEEGQNQYTRSCPNSGNVKRRPQQYTNDNIDDLLKKGYYYNKKTGEYEKKTFIKDASGKKKQITLKTIKLADYDNEGNLTGNEIQYACDPEENGEDFYIGFLTKSINPNGQCMPCCYKKNQMNSLNKNKNNFLTKCLGDTFTKKIDESIDNFSHEMLYILQDTNKINTGRIGDLPKYLDIYLNYGTNRQKTIKQHYLTQTGTYGYFYKLGSIQEQQPFLNAISILLDLSISDIIDKIIISLENDKNEQIFTSLNAGDIKTQFETVPSYINYIKTSSNIEFDMIYNILSIPNIITKLGIHIIIFDKKTITIKNELEKVKTRDDFLIISSGANDLTELNKQTVILMKENNNYYPIVLISKIHETSKSIDIIKSFTFNNTKDNILNHINDFYIKNLNINLTNLGLNNSKSLTTSEINEILILLKKEYQIKYQYIDTRNKCKFIVTNDDMLIPVVPSGSLYNIRIVKSIDKYIQSFEKTFEFLKKIYKETNKKINIKPAGVYYDSKNKNMIKINSIFTNNQEIIPVIATEISIEDIEKLNIIYDYKPLYDKIDLSLQKIDKNIIVDDRITKVATEKYNIESYQLFRLELSEYLNDDENSDQKQKIIKILNNEKLTKINKSNMIKLIIYKLIDDNLYRKYKSIVGEFAGGGKKFILIDKKEPNIINYKLNNDRVLCKIHDKDKCNTHCKWSNSNNSCLLNISIKMSIEFVNRVSDELVQNNIKAYEILKIDNYFVSDIIDQNIFTEKPNQIILKSTNNAIKKLLNETFGKNTLAIKIGRRKVLKYTDINYQQLNIDNPLKNMKLFFIQTIIDNNLTLYRSYVNSYYWIKNSLSDVINKNLGFCSPLQTKLAIYFKSNVIDWLSNIKNKKIIDSHILKFFYEKKNSKNIVNDFIITLSKDINIISNCIIELYVLNQLNDIPIIIYNQHDDIIYIFDKKIIFNNYTDKYNKEFDVYINNKHEYINLKFIFITNNYIPDHVHTIYFKN
jgi:hypothetical protein